MAKLQLLTGSLAALALATTTTFAQTFQGDGTSYTLGQVGQGNCAFMAAPAAASQNYAAINQAQWDNLKNCGKCAQVSCVDDACPDKSVSEIVYIVDRCPECKQGDLDMSPSVFKKITGSSPSRLKVAWKFVDCPGTNKLQYCLKDGSNPYFVAIQPASAGTGIASMKINGKATTMVDSAFYYVLNSQSPVDLSAVKVALTSSSGATVEETISLSVGSCTPATSQFGSGSPVTPPATTVPKPTSSAPVATPKPSTPATTSTPKPAATSKAPTTPVPTTKIPKPTKTPKATRTPKPDVASDATIAPTPVPSSASGPVTEKPKTPAPTANDNDDDDDNDNNDNSTPVPATGGDDNDDNDNDNDEVVVSPSPSPTMKPAETPNPKPATTKKPSKCKSKFGRK